MKEMIEGRPMDSICMDVDGIYDTTLLKSKTVNQYLHLEACA